MLEKKATIRSSEITENEATLLRQVLELKNALRVTLDYVENELQPTLPDNIRGFRELVQDIVEDHEIVTDPVRDLLALLTMMARFLHNTSELELFSKRSPTGFVDWIILSVIANEPPGLTDRQLFRQIGATHKRTRRLVEDLAKSGFLSLSPKDDANSPAISLTTAGQARLDDDNAALLRVLNRFLYRQPLHIVWALSRLKNFPRLHDRAAEMAAKSGS